MLRIFEFLGLGNQLRREQIPDIRRSSVAWYETNQARGGGSQTRGSADSLRQHQTRLTSDQIQSLLDLLDEHLRHLVSPYLRRWLD